MSTRSDASDGGRSAESRDRAQDAHGAAPDPRGRSGGFLFFVEPGEESVPERSQVGALEEGQLGESLDERRDAAGPSARHGVGRDKLTPYDFGIPLPGAPDARHRGDDPRDVEPPLARGVAGGGVGAFDTNVPRAPAPRTPPRHLAYVATEATALDAAASTGRRAEYDTQRPGDVPPAAARSAAPLRIPGMQLILWCMVTVNLMAFAAQATYLYVQAQHAEQSETVVMVAARELLERADRGGHRDASGDASVQDGLRRVQPAQPPAAAHPAYAHELTGIPERPPQSEPELTTFGALGPTALAEPSSSGLTRAIVVAPIDTSERDLAAALEREEKTRFAVMPAGPALAPRPMGSAGSCRAPATPAATAEKPAGAAKPVGYRRYADGGRNVVARPRPEAAAQDSNSPQCEPLP